MHHLSFFLHPETESGTVGVSVIMDQNIHQNDPVFKGILQSFYDGTVTKTQADILLKRCLSHLPTQEYKYFCDNALYVMPTWARIIPITVEYLKKNQKPVAWCDIKYSHRVDQRNHAINTSYLPKRTALAEGIVVMLLKNEIVELGLKNVSIGFVNDIVYKDTTGLRGLENFKQHPTYVIVQFPDCKIPKEDKIMPGWPRTYVPIVPYHDRCDYKCCAAIQLPLRLCKAITIHKYQGQYVDPNEV
jgi:hypothetical protein